MPSAVAARRRFSYWCPPAWNERIGVRGALQKLMLLLKAVLTQEGWLPPSPAGSEPEEGSHLFSPFTHPTRFPGNLPWAVPVLGGGHTTVNMELTSSHGDPQ